MELTNVTQIIIDSGTEDYKGLFEPSANVEWIDPKTDKLSYNGISHYYSAACFPYFVFEVEVEKKDELLRSLLECMENHLLKINKDVSVYTTKFGSEELTDDEWEVKENIKQNWSIDCLADLLIVQNSMDNLVRNIKKELLRM